MDDSSTKSRNEVHNNLRGKNAYQIGTGWQEASMMDATAERNGRLTMMTGAL